MSAALGSLVVDLSLQSAAFQKGMDQATRAFERFERQGKNMNKSMDFIASSLGSVKTAAIGAVAAFASFSTLDNMIKASERVRTLKASFEALLGSGDRAADMFKRISELSNDVGAPIQTVAEATQRLSIGLTGLGATNKQIAGVVENFIKLGRIGGTSMNDVNGALVQFGQALASGKLQGDELRSILERMPLLAKLIADEMGVGVGEIRKLGSEGKITADILANALLKATDNIGTQFANLPRTSEQAFNAMQNKAQEVGAAIADVFAMGDLKITGLDLITKSLDGIGKMAKLASDAMKAFGDAWEKVPDARKAYTLVAAFTAVGAAVAGLALANPFTALIAAAGVAAVAIVSNFDKVVNFFNTIVPASLESLKAAFAGMAKAVVVIIKELGTFVTSAFANMFNPVLEAAGKVGKIIGQDWNIGKISGDFNVLDGAISGLDETITGAGKKIDEYFAAYERGTPVVENFKKSQSELFGTVTAVTEEQKKQAQAIKEGLDPQAAMAREMEKVAELQKLGLITYQEMTAKMQEIRAEYEDTATATERAGAAQETLSQQLEKVLLSIDPAAKAAADLSEIMKVLDQSLAAGLLTWDQYAEAVNKAKNKIDGQDSMKKSIEEIKDAVTGFSRQFVDGIIDAAFEGKLTFDKLLKDMAKSIAKFMANKMIQQFFDSLSGGGAGGKGGGGFFDLIVKGIGGIFGGGKAHGAAFNKGVEFFASGGIVGSPTAFGMSGGRFGVMGEAGPEAIIPLKRSASGDLGVRSSPVNITVNNNAPVDVAVAEKEDPNGMKQIEIMIDRRVSKGFSDGTYDKPLRGAFGLTRQGY